MDNVQQSSFFSRNALWLRPLMAGVVLAVAPMIGATLVPEHAETLELVAMLGIFLSAALAGFGVMMSDTFTARLLAAAAMIGAVAVIVNVVFELTGLPRDIAHGVLVAVFVWVILTGRSKQHASPQ